MKIPPIQHNIAQIRALVPNYATGEVHPNDVPDVPVWKSVMIDWMEAYDASPAVARQAIVMIKFQVLKIKRFL